MGIFNKVPRGKIVRNKFDLSYTNNFTMKTGLLYPVLAEEIAPGDIFSGGTGMVLRSQPTIAPNFTNYYAEVRYFYVPNRLLWSGFEDFMMDQDQTKAALKKPKQSVHPYMYWNPSTMGDGPVKAGSLADFFGVPTNCIESINPLPFRAYNMIWNEYFRDQNLQDPLSINEDLVQDSILSYDLLRVNWRKDYFSSALPWTQRGEAVNMPADVYLKSLEEVSQLPNGEYQRVVRAGQVDGEPAWVPANWSSSIESNLPGALRSLSNPNISGGGGLNNAGGNLAYVSAHTSNPVSSSASLAAYLDPNHTLGLDVNIRDLRFATAVQRFLEKEALVGGGRYADWIRGIYGVNIGDATLQRPLYLGGGRNGINISPVEQTSSTNETTPQGNLAGKGYMSGLFKMNRPTLFAEHGWLIGLMYIRPEALYYRGLNKHLTKSNRFDYIIPGFERLGEQEVYNREVYALSADSSSSAADILAIRHKNDGTFGYQSRQAEYKSHGSEIHGEIKTSLSQYAVARGFEDDLTDPVPLNSDFVECNPDESNLFAVSEEVADPWIVNSRNVCVVYRNLQKYPSYGL